MWEAQHPAHSLSFSLWTRDQRQHRRSTDAGALLRPPWCLHSRMEVCVNIDNVMPGRSCYFGDGSSEPSKSSCQELLGKTFSKCLLLLINCLSNSKNTVKVNMTQCCWRSEHSCTSWQPSLEKTFVSSINQDFLFLEINQDF